MSLVETFGPGGTLQCRPALRRLFVVVQIPRTLADFAPGRISDHTAFLSRACTQRF